MLFQSSVMFVQTDTPTVSFRNLDPALLMMILLTCFNNTSFLTKANKIQSCEIVKICLNSEKIYACEEGTTIENDTAKVFHILL